MTTICCFCLENINNNSFIELECKHQFHTICWNQYNDKKCPLCRNNSISYKKMFNHVDIKQYNDNDYVWVFGSFIPFTNERQNYLICNINNKKYISGYFWRLFDENITQHLEEQYEKYNTDATSNIIEICIGSSNYKIIYNNLLNELYFDNVIDVKICIQENQNNKYRPIMRIKWKDLSEYLFLVGIHDNIFLDKYYVYLKNDKYYLFNIKEQQIINNAYTNKQNEELIFQNKKYIIDTNNNILKDNNTQECIIIELFNKQQIINY